MHDDRQNKPTLSLGQYLASIRRDRQKTLREVEEGTKKQVSNAYLSQVENEKIKKPDPNILHALSEFYRISYENLMELAGYVIAAGTREDQQQHGRIPTFAEHSLTKDEEEQLLDYLQHIRTRKRPNG